MPPRNKVLPPSRPLRVRASVGSRPTTDHARLQHLTHEVEKLRCEVQGLSDWLKSPAGPVLHSDLNKLEKKIVMKLSDVKKAIKAAAADSVEAFDELKKRLDDQQKQIEDLIAGQSDPEVSDEDFLADLQKLSDNNKALAEIVPNSAE